MSGGLYSQIIKTNVCLEIKLLLLNIYKENNRRCIQVIA